MMGVLKDHDCKTGPVAQTPKGRVIHGSAGRVWLREDGIVENAIDSESDLTLAEAKEMIVAISEAMEGRERPVLVVFSKKGGLTHEARAYLSAKETQAGRTALALCTSSLVGKTIGNIFLKITKQVIPIRLFTDRDKAIAWLKEFVR